MLEGKYVVFLAYLNEICSNFKCDSNWPVNIAQLLLQEKYFNHAGEKGLNPKNGLN